jgi:hypothetical protein
VTGADREIPCYPARRSLGAASSMRSRSLWIAAFLAGCDDPTLNPQDSFVSPLAGQTGVPSDMELLVRGGAVEIPPDYAVGDVIRVVDLEDGGFVAGQVLMEGWDLRFVPEEPWADGRRYAWTVDPAGHVPHGPELPIPANLVGTSAFGTSEAIDLLGSTLDDDQRACLVASHPLEEAGEVRITANDVEVEDVTLEELREIEWVPGFARDPSDPYVQVWCVNSATPIAAGAVLRVWWGEQGPWSLTVREIPVEDLVIELHRGVLP